MASCSYPVHSNPYRRPANAQDEKIQAPGRCWSHDGKRARPRKLLSEWAHTLSVRGVFEREQALTPGAMRCPQKTAPVEGTTRGKWPGVPEVTRRDSLMTPRRYGSFSNSEHSAQETLYSIP